jgi:hypothetical protein
MILPRVDVAYLMRSSQEILTSRCSAKGVRTQSETTRASSLFAVRRGWVDDRQAALGRRIGSERSSRYCDRGGYEVNRPLREVFGKIVPSHGEQHLVSRSNGRGRNATTSSGVRRRSAPLPESFPSLPPQPAAVSSAVSHIVRPPVTMPGAGREPIAWSVGPVRMPN